MSGKIAFQVEPYSQDRNMSNPRNDRLLAVTLIVSATLCASSAAQVTIEPDAGNYRVKATEYQAVVATDGCLTQLQVNGMEFFHFGAAFPRGAYLFQNGLVQLPRVEQASEETISAKSDKASARYQFSPRTVTWEVTNLTRERLLCLIVFHSAVAVVAGDDDEYEKTPTTFPWRTTTWFRDKSKLHIRGGTRVWGPWADGYQVWEAIVNAGETRTITMEVGDATEIEQKRVANAMTQLNEPPKDPKGPMWDMKALSRPPAYRSAEGFQSEGVKAIFYDGLPYRGKPTQVFAWLGLPKVEEGRKVPGMVLVHGGGGTAFAEWVRSWTSRGYAAIAMDTCGCVPRGSYGNWERHLNGGPPGWGGWDQIDRPRTDQWTYHAVADAILANSLLRSLREVDPKRIGLTGISWGGYLTCIIAGVDHRFKFAVPVYGCGFTNEHGFAGSVNSLGKERADRWRRWWDPSSYLGEACMPMLWVTGSNDFAYTLNALQKSYRLPKGPRTLCVRLRMPHGHGGAGENPEEIHVFANSIVRGGDPLPRLTGQGRNGNDVWATYKSMHPVLKAELNYTLDTGKWQDRGWKTTPAHMDATSSRVTATLPEGTIVYYINLHDDRNLVVSTEHEELN